MSEPRRVKGIEDWTEDYMEEVFLRDEHREIECPECGDVRNMEPDAQEYKCQCGVVVDCPTPL